MSDIFDAFDHDDYISATAAAIPPAATEPRKAGVVPASYKAVEASYREGCRKCHGTGFWRPGYPCFSCKGKGSNTFRTSPEVRAQARARTEVKRAEKLADQQEWRNANQAEIAWLETTADRQRTREQPWRFPLELAEALTTYGTLTDNQLAAVRKCMARDKERQTARAAEQAAPTVDTGALKAAFNRATSKGLRYPRITIGNIVLKPAPATGKNPGAIYVTDNGTYLGRIDGGKFFRTRDCTDAQGAQVLAFAQDPAAAAKAYGIRTGVCCVCNATLTNAESIARGVGPICAEKFGF